MWICKNCENQNEENFRFCWSCGNSKSESRKTVRGNTTELSFPKKVESAEKEIPQVKKIKTEAKKTEIKIKEEEPLEIEVRTKEIPAFEEEDEAEIITTMAAKKAGKEKPEKEKPKTKSPKSTIKQPEIFSTFSPGQKKTENIAEDQKSVERIDWQKEIFKIAVRLIGLYFIFQVILALPDLANLVYSSISSVFSGEIGFVTYLFFFLSQIAKPLFYLIIGIYLISSGKLLLRLLPAD